MRTSTDRDRLLTLEQVAERLHVSLVTLYQWRWRGEGPVGIPVGRRIIVRERDLEEWLEGRREQREPA